MLACTTLQLKSNAHRVKFVLVLFVERICSLHIPCSTSSSLVSLNYSRLVYCSFFYFPLFKHTIYYLGFLIHVVNFIFSGVFSLVFFAKIYRAVGLFSVDHCLVGCLGGEKIHLNNGLERPIKGQPSRQTLA